MRPVIQSSLSSAEPQVSRNRAGGGPSGDGRGQPRGRDDGPTVVRGTGVAVAVAISAILHGGLLGVLDAIDDRTLVGPLPGPPALPLQPLPPPSEDDAPIDVVLLPPGAADLLAARPADDVTAAAPPDAPARPTGDDRGPQPATPGSPAAPGDDQRLAIVDPSVGVPGGESSQPGERAPGVLSMRSPRAIAPAVDLWHVPLTVAPRDPSRPVYVPPEPSGQLDPDGGGTFRTDRPGFTGHVARDGRISFDDKPSFGVQVNIPRPTKVARAAARRVETWFDDPGAALREGDADPDELPGVRATPKEKVDHSNPEAVILPIITGGFDATDAVMRATGQDPYLAAKLKWMDETRAERLEMAKAHRATQLADSTRNMRRHLARLWGMPGLDDAARKAALFELWDDCDDRGDAAVVEACTRTRAAVIAFIRGRLPAGSPAAFTAAELRAFNARRTAAVAFAPYE